MSHRAAGQAVARANPSLDSQSFIYNSLHKLALCTMTKGLSKLFSNAKGYGFIIQEGRQNELFAHYTAVSMQGYKKLIDGEAVEFEIERSDKGLQAKNIRRFEDAEATTTAAPNETVALNQASDP